MDKTQRELTTKQRIIYGSGYLGVTLCTFTISTWLTGYYLPPESDAGTIIPAMTLFGKTFAATALFGMAMGAGRIVDAISSPFIGYWGDNTRSRWGRRRPFITLGTPLLVILFILLFSPPYEAGSTGNFYFLLAIISLFYFFYTLVITPYLALLPEIARSTEERLKLASWQTIFNMAGFILTMIVGALLVSSIGYRWMAVIFGVVIGVAFIHSSIRTKESEDLEAPQKVGVLHALKQTFMNGPFMIYLFAQVFIWFGFNLIISSLNHVVVALMGLGSTGVAIAMLLTLGTAIVTIPLVIKLTAKYGKKKTYICMVSAFIIAFSAIYLLGSPGVGKWNMPLGMIIFFILGIPASAFFVIPNSVMGEVIDYDAKRTGHRREAIYFSVQALINKFGLAFSSLFLGYIFSFGFTEDNPLGIRLLGPWAAVFVAIGLIIFSFYPLEDRAHKA